MASSALRDSVCLIRSVRVDCFSSVLIRVQAFLFRASAWGRPHAGQRNEQGGSAGKDEERGLRGYAILMFDLFALIAFHPR
jgi:hypothetical protein